MNNEPWQSVLVYSLALNAVLGFAYRVYRLTKSGPMSDVIGQAVLGMVLAAFALAASVGQGWVRWAALVYALLFGLAVMPIWVLAVLIPSRPRAVDYAFTALYWAALVVVAISAVLA